MRLKVKGRWILILLIGLITIVIWFFVSLCVGASHKARLESLFFNIEQIVLHYSNHSKTQQEEVQTLVAITNNLKPLPDKSSREAFHPNTSQGTTFHGKVVHQTFGFKVMVSLGSNRDVCTENPSFLVFIHSHPANSQGREAIRETWASQALPLGGVVIYVLGAEYKYHQAIKREAEEYGDILQYDFSDSYRNLVYKSIMSLRFTKALNCSSMNYIVKTDDDVILNLKRIRDILKSLQSQNNLLLGSQASNNRVQRAGKWRVPEELYPGTDYPMHLSGAAYVLSVDTVCKLAKLSESTPVLPVEDVYITGILAQEAGIEPRARLDFPSWLKRGPRAECDYTRGRTVGLHGCTSKQMKQLWNKLTSGLTC